MFWIIITIIAHLLFAVVYIIDKHIVSNTALKPISYVFFSGIFQIVYIILVPFGFVAPGMEYVAVGIFNGALFLLALLIFYKAMKISEASRVVPVVGGAIPIFTFFLAFIFLKERLNFWQIIAFIFFVLGGFVLSSKIKKGKIEIMKGAALAIFAGLLFAIYYFLIKLVSLNATPFSGFILLQVGGFLGSLILLSSKKNREIIFSTSKETNKKIAFLFIPNKILGAAAAILIYYAISLKNSSVTIINSMQSIQYVFILFLAFILSKKIPNLFKEQTDKKIIGQKIIAIFLIGIGVYLLAFNL